MQFRTAFKPGMEHWMQACRIGSELAARMLWWQPHLSRWLRLRRRQSCSGPHCWGNHALQTVRQGMLGTGIGLMGQPQCSLALRMQVQMSYSVSSM